MKVKPITLFLAASAASYVFTEASPSDAYYRQWHASSCAYGSASVQYSSVGLSNSSTSTAVDVYCDVTDDSNYPKNTVTSLNAYVYDASSTEIISAYACVGFRLGWGGSCGWGTSTSLSGTGVFEMPISTSTWLTYPTEIAYIDATLPRNYGGYLKGFRTLWP